MIPHMRWVSVLMKELVILVQVVVVMEEVWYSMAPLMAVAEVVEVPRLDRVLVVEEMAKVVVSSLNLVLQICNHFNN